MKVPFTANSPNISKPLNYTINPTFPATTTTTPYEPKSVLELRRSPSPIADQKPDPIQLDEADHVLINQQLVDWDSLMRELGLHDDSTPVSKSLNQLGPNSAQTQYSTLPELPDSNQFLPADFGLLSDIPHTYSVESLNHNSDAINGGGDWNAGFDYVDELIRLAECFETNTPQLGLVILARLNHRLSSPIGKPLQRAAFYFKEALQSLLTGSTHRVQNSSNIIQSIKAHKTFSNISPIPMFSCFTANQAVLEALDGSTNVHVIDFEIGLGSHWASFMKELADKPGPPKSLRISAVISDEQATEISALIREILTQLARELNIRFNIDFVTMQSFGYLSFKTIKFGVDGGEKVAVLLSPAIFRRLGGGFLNDLRRVSPHVVVHVDAEGQIGNIGGPPYRQAVVDGLEFYSTVLESLEAANVNGGGDNWIKGIETFEVFPKIVEGVEAAGRRRGWWREALVSAGMREVGLSKFAEFQAECLLRRVQVRGFHVVKRQAELLLCWHDRPIVATSAWRY